MARRRRAQRLTAMLGGAVVLMVTAATGTFGQQPRFPSQLPVPKTSTPAAGAPAVSGTPSPETPKPQGPAPGGARDPFDPLVRKPTEGTGSGKPAGQEIAGLKLVGVIWDAAAHEQIRALVETATGLGYYLRVNEEKFGGTVVAIDRDRVQFQVREAVPGGASRVRTVELRLPQPSGQ